MKLGTRMRNGWTGWHVAGCLSMVLLGIACTFEAWNDIIRITLKDPEASHILLVPIVALWLVWVRRGRIRYCRPGGAVYGTLMIVVGGLISWYGYYNAVQSLWHGGAVLVLIGCIVSVVGKDVLIRFMPAFIVLVFLVPVPGMARQQIALPLQRATAVMTQITFDTLGMPIDRMGNILICNGVDVGIAEACNGMRGVFALALVSYAFAFGTPLHQYARILVLLCSPLSAIACNVIRLIPTVWLYGYYPNHVADQFHDLSGWVMYPIAFMILMGVLRILRWALIPVSPYTLAYD